MSFDVENALITKILEEDDLRSTLRQKITKDFFSDDALREVFFWLVQHHQKYARVPSLGLLQREFPEFEPVETDDDLMALVEEVKSERLYADMAIAVKEVTETTRDDPKAGFELLRAKAGELALLHSGTDDSDVTHEIEEMRSEYEQLKSGEGMIGVPYPWPYLNSVLLGMHPQELIGFYARPKCIPLDEPVLCANGAFKTIQDVWNIVSLNRHGAFVHGDVAQKHKVVTRRVLYLETTTGYGVRVGDSHRMLRPGGDYVKAKHINVGDWVGVARSLTSVTPWVRGDLKDTTAELLGLLVGDGNYTRAEVQFTNVDGDVLERLRTLIAEYSCTLSLAERDCEYRIVAESGRTNQVLDLLRELGIHGSKSEDKRVPTRLFGSGGREVAAFLGGLLSTDGTVGTNVIRWYTSSSVLARQVKHLLLRLGVVGTITYTPGNGGYSVSVQAEEQHEALVYVIAPYCSEMTKRDALFRLVNGKKRKRHDDGIPFSPELMAKIKKVKERSGLGWTMVPWRGFSRDKLFRRTGCISRHLLRILGEVFDSSDLVDEANSHVRWERVSVIVDEGKQPCADIGVAEHHNFLVGDFITHNSMKTWVSLYVANFVHEQYGLVPAYFSCEMPKRLIRRRLAAMRARVPYKEFRAGQLTESQEKAFHLALEELHDSPPFMICGVDGTGSGAIMEIRGKCEEYDTDLAVVDGAYFLMEEESHRAFRTITQGLKKQVAEPLNIPVVMTSQANRSAEKTRGTTTTGVAFGDSLAQDCDALIHLIRDPQHAENKELMFTLPAMREAEGGTFTIHAKPAGDFSEKHIFEVEEGNDAVAGTDEGGIL